MNIIDYISKQSKLFLLAFGLVLVWFLWIIDYLVGPDISLLIFYIIPIFLITWFVGRLYGLIISVISVIIWLVADVSSGMTRTIPYFSVAVEGGFFLIVANILSLFRKSWEHEKNLARTDPLTGIANSRYFFEAAQIELSRADRYQHPVSLAYIDIDDFKQINDNLGHIAGDRLLALVAQTIKENIRTSDIAARLGGDELAILLPETDEAQANALITKIQNLLINAVNGNKRPVTFSIGVVTCHAPYCTLEEMVHQADILMYSVKTNGKNSVNYKTIANQTVRSLVRY